MDVFEVFSRPVGGWGVAFDVENVLGDDSTLENAEVTVEIGGATLGPIASVSGDSTGAVLRAKRSVTGRLGLRRTVRMSATFNGNSDTRADIVVGRFRTVVELHGTSKTEVSGRKQELLRALGLWRRLARSAVVVVLTLAAVCSIVSLVLALRH